MNESLSPRKGSSIMCEGSAFMDQSVWSLERRRIETGRSVNINNNTDRY